MSAMLHYPTRKSNKRRLNQRPQSAMGGILKIMGLNFKHTIIGTALALSVISILACGGSAPAAQPAPSASTVKQSTAATATTAPVVARVDTPAPPSPTTIPTTSAAPTPEPVEEPTATATAAPTVETRAEQPTQQPAGTPASTATRPTATATTEPIPQPTAALSPQVGTNVSDLAPDFTLPSARSGEFNLEAFRGDKNVVLVFYRAFW